jgi:hypothetical protein
MPTRAGIDGAFLSEVWSARGSLNVTARADAGINEFAAFQHFQRGVIER